MQFMIFVPIYAWQLKWYLQLLLETVQAVFVLYPFCISFVVTGTNGSEMWVILSKEQLKVSKEQLNVFTFLH